VRRAGCGCAGLGCAVALVCLLILGGAVGILAGNWDSLARPRIPDPPPAVADIPARYLELYRAAGERFNVDWTVLAGIGEVESDHGRNPKGCAPNAAGARGPMQFLPATFAVAARLAGIGQPDICDPADAIPAAAAYLVSNGAPDDWLRALRRYNPADGYAELVLGWARRYGAGGVVVWPIDNARFTQGFGPTDFALEPPRCWRGTCYAHFHDGIDLAAPLGTQVRAIAAGQVIFAGRFPDGAIVVEVEHAAGVLSMYVHLQPDLRVSEGQAVSAGTPVGVVGLTGITTGPHLHLGLHVHGEPFDPLLVLPPKP
jgi:murein DD-endopeptidase MepM/ murein hydrolase activator NlpD